MAYTPTIIRFEEEQYKRLKQEALERKKSLSAVVREEFAKIFNQADVSQIEDKDSLSEVLKRTKGILVDKEFYIDEKKRRQRELEASKRRKIW